MKSLVIVALEGLASVLSKVPVLASDLGIHPRLEKEVSPTTSQLKLQRLREARLRESLELQGQVLSLQKGLHGEDGEAALRAKSEIALFVKDQGE